MSKIPSFHSIFDLTYRDSGITVQIEFLMQTPEAFEGLWGNYKYAFYQDKLLRMIRPHESGTGWTLVYMNGEMKDVFLGTEEIVLSDTLDG